MIDLHSHLLPGFDDGSKSLAESLQMAEVYQEAGFTHVVATPHVIPDYYEHTKPEIIDAVEKLQSAITAKGLTLQVLPAAEYYLTDDLPDRLSKGEILTVNDNGKYILVELPVEEVPFYASEVLFDLRLAGVTPVVVHPERNTTLASHPEMIYNLLEKGILFQVTAGCLTGLFGPRAKKISRSFVKKKLVQFIATDAHNSGRRLRAGIEAAQIMGSASSDLITANPSAVISGSQLKVTFDTDNGNKYEHGWLGSLFSRFKPAAGHSHQI